MPSLAALVPPPADLEMRAWAPDTGDVTLESLDDLAGLMTGYVFIDGSADIPADTRRRRAGWAVVEVEPHLGNGQLIRKRAVWGTAPSEWPQSAQAGEFAAAVAATTLSHPDAIIYTDCLAVQRLMQTAPAKAQHPSRLWAGAFRAALSTRAATS